VQYAGDKAASDKFIDDYTKWDENLHGVIAGEHSRATALSVQTVQVQGARRVVGALNGLCVAISR
jgi:hypothetical protein